MNLILLSYLFKYEIHKHPINLDTCTYTYIHNNYIQYYLFISDYFGTSRFLYLFIVHQSYQKITVS